MSCAVCRFSPTRDGITNVASWTGAGTSGEVEAAGEEAEGLDVGIWVTTTVSVTLGAGAAHELRSAPTSDTAMRLVAALKVTRPPLLSIRGLLSLSTALS